MTAMIREKWKARSLMLAVAALALFSLGAHAWFGESASRQESAELEFRGTFIIFVYYLLYGTFLGVLVDRGLLEIFNGLEGMVLMNPPVYSPIIFGILRYLIMVLQPVYILAVLSTGMYLIFMSGSPESRNKAKSLLFRLIASMVVVSLSASILQLLFTLSSEAAADMIHSSGVDAKQIFVETLDDLVRLFASSTLTTFDAGYIFLVTVFLLVFAMFTMLTLRYLILLTFTLVFPLSVLLYTFESTRGLGRLFLEQTILWSFAQVVVAVIVVTVNIGVRIFGIGGDLKTMMGLAAFIAVVFAPFMIVGMIRRFLP